MSSYYTKKTKMRSNEGTKFQDIGLKIKAINAFNPGNNNDDDVFVLNEANDAPNKMKLKVKAFQSSLFAKAAFDDNLEESKIDKESSEDYLANRFQKNVCGLQFGVQMDKGNRVHMDTSKAMGVLGFATHQNLEQTSYDEICQAFLKRSKKVMRKRELALEAEESKDPKLMKLYSVQNDNWRKEIVLINEALQHLTRKKDKSNKAYIKFKTRGHDTTLITKTLAAFELDPERAAARQKDPLEITSDSVKAQKLAKEIESSIDGYSDWKRAHGKKPRSKPDSYDILDVMEDLLDDFGEMVDEQFPQQSRDRIESYESDKEEKYASDKSSVRRTKSFKENPATSKFYVEVTKKPSNQYTRRQTEGNLTFGDVGDLVNRKSRVERSKSLKGSSLSNLSHQNEKTRDRIASTGSEYTSGINRSKSLKEKSGKASSSSGMGRSKSLRGTVSSVIQSKRRNDGRITDFGDLVSTAMKSRYKSIGKL